MTSTNNFIGIGEQQRISSRVLKPPGGGSSIVFDEDENMKPIKSKPQQQQKQSSPEPQPQPEPEPQAKEEAPQADKPEKQPPQPQQEAVEPKLESNGMNKHDSIKEDVAATTTRDSNPTPAPATNGQQSPALNGSPAVNGINGSVSSGSTSSMSPYPGGTPKHHNTQNRIFGENQQNGGNPFTPRRRLRDHERSTIFTPDAASNGTHRPDANGSSGSSSSCLSSGTPEARTPDQAHSQPQQQQQQPQRQRVPPGGFSTQLW